MPKAKTVLQSQVPYHIYARCINRQWFEIPTRSVWDIMSNYLYFLHHGFGFQIHSFVLMSNHYHALITTPEANLDRGMNYFQREVSRMITRYSGRINQTFGGPYEWCLVNSYSYYLNAYKYVYRNPVRAQICERCEDYEYSTLRGLLGQQHLFIPTAEDTLMFDPNFNERNLAWLNRSKEEDEMEVQRALRKSQFTFAIAKGSGKPIRAEDFVY